MDAIGGVEVDVDMDMHYVDIGGRDRYRFEQRPPEANGDDALDFVRYRKSNDGKKCPATSTAIAAKAKCSAQIADKLKSSRGVPKIARRHRVRSATMCEWTSRAEKFENMLKTYYGISSRRHHVHAARRRMEKSLRSSGRSEACEARSMRSEAKLAE